MKTFDPEQTPMRRISRAVDDIVYEKIEYVCNSFIFLVEDFRDTQIPRTSKKDFDALLKEMAKRKAKWMER